ncbi:MAG: rRNA pseudouridine synthase [Bacteroidales bacterium]|nr:pseudouridine synthase [Anaerotignum sp.]MCI5680239.1 rRNA pseudouridine synthase [Bacteroidales bacterium]MDY3926033.1 pseudouridine synthase [Anaerotignum sp.]
MEERLQKYLAEAGVASRRKAEELIAQGKVKVNGKVVTQMGMKIDPAKDEVTYLDKKVTTKDTKMVYIMLYKPEGYVTTAKEQFGRPAVMDLIKGVKERIFPVGRLDYDTSGLLLLTNDGDLTYNLTHPKHDVDKTYIAKLYGIPDEGALQKFRRGVVIDGKRTKPAKIQVIDKDKDGRFCTAEIIIHEGRNRQVRKMCEAIKHPVAQLKRVATGDLKLGDLQKGKYRHLTEKEIKYLKKL